MRGQRLFNYQAFEDATVALEREGWQVVSPHNEDIRHDWVRAAWDVIYLKGVPRRIFTSVELTDTFNIDAALLHDCELIDECEAIMLLPGWQESAGVRRELEHAMDSNKRLFFYGSAAPEYPDPVSWSDVRFVFAEQDRKRTEQLSVADQPVSYSAEVRVVDPVTGGEKGKKLARFDLLPGEPLWQLAEHYGKGCAKYADRNWEQGVAWSLCFAALMRHAWAFWNGEDIDPETGSCHMTAVAWHAMALTEYLATHPELDDRPNKEQAA